MVLIKRINYLDNFIYRFLLVELSLRFFACDDKRHFFKDPLNSILIPFIVLAA